MRRRLLIAALAAAMAGCGFRPEKIFASYVNVQVFEAGRSSQCHTAGPEPRVTLLADAAAVQAWQAGHGVEFTGGPSTLADQPHAVIEMGAKPTAGYGLAVSRGAVLRGDLLIVQANFIGPPEGALTAQMLTQPCVLVRLPPGRYGIVEVQDPAGRVQARGGVPAAPAPPPASGGPAK